MKNRPTAIFACNDEMAAGVYQVAREMGLSIPEDLSIVGFDDTPVSSRLWPPLTTIRWPIVEMGRSAAAKLLEPKAQHVTLPGGTIKNEDDLRSWLNEAEGRIRKKLAEGPVIV